MDGYDGPRVQYASPRRQLSRSGKKNTIARDLDTRTPRYSPPPPATPPPASPARRSPSPEAPSYTRRRPSPPPFGSPDTLRSQYTVRTGGSAAAWERALHRRVAALEHQLKAEVAANDELRRRAAGDNVGDDDRSLAAAQAAWRRERRVLERQLHAARAAAADAVSRKPHPSAVDDDESVDPAALVGRAADALDGASSLPSPVSKLRRKLKAWALRSAFSVASRVPYRAVARRFAFWRGASTVPPLLEGDDRTLRVVARVMRRIVKDWLHDSMEAAFGDWVAVVNRSQGADWVTRVFSTHFTRRAFRRWLRAAEASVQSRRLAELTNASDVSGRRQSQEIAKYEKELRPAFPPPHFEERALIPSEPQVASPREVAAGVLEVAQTGSSSRRTGLHSLIVKSGYLLYERLPGVWRRRFLKLRAVSFDIASNYAGPCVESSLDEDSEPLATFPLDSTRVRSGAAEAGLHPMLFVDAASGASERFAAATRRDRDAWLQAFESAREQHHTVIDSLRGNVPRPPPPPDEDREPERTHLSFWCECVQKVPVRPL